MRHILLVDDEVNVLNALKRALRQPGLPEPGKPNALLIETFTDPFQALQHCCTTDFDLVISDQHMPQMMGVDFLRALKDVAPNTVRLMLSAATEMETAISAINEAQVFRFISKPWQDKELRENLVAAFEQRDRLLEDAHRARVARLGKEASAQDIEALRLEQEEPGITQVTWGPDGSIIL